MRFAMHRAATFVLITVAAFALSCPAHGADAASAAAAGIASAAFAPRSPRAPGAPLFTRLSPESTGITAVNRYDDPQMWGAKYREFAFGSVGSGVAIADYDGDGRPDVFVVCKTGANHLYRNLGAWRFDDVTEKAGVAGPTDAWKTGAVFADVNNDGRPDLYVCRYNAPNLLYVNRGDGTFVESAHAAGLDIVDASASAAFGDFDRDGWLDVYLVTNLRDATDSPDGEADRLFRNRGDGTFVEVTHSAGISGKAQGHAALFWDYDEDGWLDIYVTNDYGWPDQLWHNRRDGNFSEALNETMPTIPRFSMGADLGDVNNDGRLDLFVADMMPTGRVRDQRSLADARAHSVDAPDRTLTPQTMRNALLVSTGTGHFLEAAFLSGVAATDWTWSVLLEDFDDDGRVDLHVTNGMIREYFDFDLRTRLEAAPPLDVPRIMKTVPVLRERHLAFRNRGDLRFEDASAAWGLDEVGVSFGAAVADLDGDGDLDLIYANYDAPPTVCRNDESDAHRIVFALHGTASNRFGVGALVRIETPRAGTQVRRISAGRGYASSSEPIAHFGLGDETRVHRVTIDWPDGARQTFENLESDQRYEITEPTVAGAAGPGPASPRPATTSQTQFVEVAEPLGLAVRASDAEVDELAAQPLLTIRHNRLGPAVAIGDLDGDGADDVVFGGGTGSAARVMLATRDGTFRAAPFSFPSDAHSVAAPDASLLLLDADGDGRLDILETKGGVARPANDAAYEPHLWLNRGGGEFAPAASDVLPPLTDSVGPAVAADFDRDGKLDVFLGGRIVPARFPDVPRSVLLANRGGKFVDVTDELAPGLASAGMVTAAMWTDVDDDGWLDLLVATEWGGVRCWRNVASRESSGARHFEEVSAQLGFTRAGTGWWNSLAAADFNGDGRLDYVAGNLGLNTRYRATLERPALLLAGSLDDSGREQLLEVEYDDDDNGEHLVPGRSRAILGRAMPWLLKKFPTAKSYASATLEDVFAPDKIAVARRLAATEFRSGVFLSRPDGRFVFTPLPRLAQIAPIFGVVAGDFDGDGNADIYAAQNSYAPIAEVGRFSGGLSQLLRGDGRGDFEAVPPGTSGLVVPGDAKGLAMLDLDRDGWPEFVVTRNDDRSLVFGNTSVDGRNSLRVALRGAPGNPTCIGARLTLELADGTREVAEISAGAGYLSQSSAACFFGFPDGNPPRRLRVRWPGGATTEHTVPARSGAIVITMPANAP